MTRISTEYERVMREGLQPRAVGAATGAGMKDRESAGKRSIPELPAEGGVFGGMGMNTSNVRVIRSRPLLVLIEGGKA